MTVRRRYVGPNILVTGAGRAVSSGTAATTGSSARLRRAPRPRCREDPGGLFLAAVAGQPTRDSGSRRAYHSTKALSPDHSQPAPAADREMVPATSRAPASANDRHRDNPACRPTRCSDRGICGAGTREVRTTRVSSAPSPSPARMRSTPGWTGWGWVRADPRRYVPL